MTVVGHCIAGIGQTNFSRDSGRSELTLAVEAIQNALEDARLTVRDVDGLVTFSFDHNDPMQVANALQLEELPFFAISPFAGGGCCIALHEAVRAVDAGLARTVVVYRALNGRSEQRLGAASAEMTTRADLAFTVPFGLVTPAQLSSLSVQRYMHEHGVSNEDFGKVTLAARHHAATNPAAQFYERPLTLAEHQASPWMVEPVLRKFDCCLETDGAVAIVVTSADRATSLEQPRVELVAGARGLARLSGGFQNFYRSDITTLPDSEVVARRLWAETRLCPEDIDVAILYDHFSPFVLMQLEAFGFCDHGRARNFIEEHGIVVGSKLPINPHGGLLGEAYLHGVNGLTEAIRQLRGTAANQADDVEHVLVTSGSALPTSAVVLRRTV